MSVTCDEIPECGHIAIDIPTAGDESSAGFNSQTAAGFDSTASDPQTALSSDFNWIAANNEPDVGNAAGNETATGDRKSLWSQVLMSSCFASAVAMSFLPEDTMLKSSLHNLLPFTIVLTFSTILIANMISHRFASHCFLVIGILLGSAALFMVVSIPLSLPLKYVVWFIYGSTIIIVVVFRMRERSHSIIFTQPPSPTQK